VAGHRTGFRKACSEEGTAFQSLLLHVWSNNDKRNKKQTNKEDEERKPKKENNLKRNKKRERMNEWKRNGRGTESKRKK
jgi:hypothetical protein